MSKSTEQDWSELKRVLEFLCGTIDDGLTLGADNLEELLSFVDVSFAVHHDMKSHTGGGASFGRGIMMSLSNEEAKNKHIQHHKIRSGRCIRLLTKHYMDDEVLGGARIQNEGKYFISGQ